MNTTSIKKYLLEIASNVNSNTTIEDVYEQLALLNDIEKSAEQEKQGKVFTHNEVKNKAKKWLK
jgi:predicted transcriptional regulator